MSSKSVCEILNSTTFVISLHDLRKECPDYDADFLDQILLELELDGELVAADGKIFPIRPRIDRAEIIPFPTSAPAPAGIDEVGANRDKGGEL